MSDSDLGEKSSLEKLPVSERCRKFRNSGCIALGFLTLITGFITPAFVSAQAVVDSKPLYRDANEPIEKRLDDLLSRMSLAEKIRQLDMYSSATALMDKHSDETHATADAVFMPEKAQALLGENFFGNGLQARVIGAECMGA